MNCVQLLWADRIGRWQEVNHISERPKQGISFEKKLAQQGAHFGEVTGIVRFDPRAAAAPTWRTSLPVNDPSTMPAFPCGGSQSVRDAFETAPIVKS